MFSTGFNPNKVNIITRISINMHQSNRQKEGFAAFIYTDCKKRIITVYTAGFPGRAKT